MAKKPTFINRAHMAVRRQAPIRWLAQRTKKQKIIGGIVLGVTIVVAAVSLIMYATWRQQAEKVVMESVLGVLTSSSVSLNGTFSSHSPTNQFTLTFKGGGSVMQGMADADLTIRTPQTGIDVTLSGAAAYAAGDMYFKVQDARAAYDQVMAKTIEYAEKEAATRGTSVTADMKTKMKEQYDTLLLPLITTIDSKWVKLTAADAGTLGAGNAKRGYECARHLVQRVKKDQNVADEFRSLYEKHRFMSVVSQLDTKDGTMGYGVTINQANVERFGQGIEKMSIFNDKKQCHSVDFAKNMPYPQSTIAGQPTGNTTTKKQRIEIRMTENTHVLTSVKVVTDSAKGNEKSTATFDLGITLNQPIQFDPPTETVPFSDVKAGLDAMQAQMTAAAATR